MRRGFAVRIGAIARHIDARTHRANTAAMLRCLCGAEGGLHCGLDLLEVGHCGCTDTPPCKTVRCRLEIHAVSYRKGCECIDTPPCKVHTVYTWRVSQGRSAWIQSTCGVQLGPQLAVLPAQCLGDTLHLQQLRLQTVGALPL
jgi:hypothetical protein